MSGLRRVYLLIAALNASPALASAGAPPADVAKLRQEVWSACDSLPKWAPDAPPPPAWIEACDRLRAPALARAWRLGAEGLESQRLEALGLVAAWAPPIQSRAALERLGESYRDADALAPVLEAAYSESRAPDKAAWLAGLLRRSRSRAVRGSASYLVAAEALAEAQLPAGRRAAALQTLRRVRARYADVATTLLGAGEPPRLGRAAASLLFRQERLVAGARLPPMRATDLDGRSVSSAGFAGRVTLIDFWATWCPPCVAAMPTLRGLAAQNRGKPFQIVSISGDASAAPVKAFVQRSGNTWAQWRAGPSGAASPEWSNGAFPFYVLVDRHGRIVAADAKLAPVLARLPGALG